MAQTAIDPDPGLTMNVTANQFKRALQSERPLIGFWNSLGTPAATEILADAGLDWILIDTEHAPNELPVVAHQLRAMAGAAATPVVRPAWNDPVLIKRILDLGVQTLLVPYVQSAQEAARAVAATRYPPLGIRGVAAVHRANRYGRVSDYFSRANDEMCVIVQLETPAALEHLEAIATVDGLDAVFIGPSDLAASLGHPGEPRHPDVRSAIEGACRRARAIRIPIGILAPFEEDAKHFLEIGFNFVAVGSDIVTLRRGVDALVERFRSGR
jgi:4-hydroxy-2-oxoheptanedioate aldolase